MRMLSNLVCILVILFPSLMPAAQVQVKQINSSQDLPEAFCTIWQKGGHYLALINLNPATEGERQPGNLSPAQEFKLNYKLLVSTEAKELLSNIYDILGLKAAPATINFKDYDGKLMEVIVKEATSSSVFFRSFLKGTFSLDLFFPPGAYTIQAHFFPAVSEEFLLVSPERKNICTLTNLPLERVKVKIEDSQGHFVPGKVTLIGLWPTKNPYFKADDPLKSSGYWESFL